MKNIKKERRTGKRLFGILLAVVLAAGLLPATVLAASLTDADPEEGTELAKHPVLTAVTSVSPNAPAEVSGGAGVFHSTVKTDMPMVILNPVFTIADVAEGVPVTAVVFYNGIKAAEAELPWRAGGQYRVGPPLTLEEYPGQAKDSIRYSFFADGAEAGTFTVNFVPEYTLIYEFTVSGLVSPAAGALPVTGGSLSCGEGYSVAGIEWRKLAGDAVLPTAGTLGAGFTKGSEALGAGESFEKGGYYTALITVQIADGYKIDKYTHADLAELRNGDYYHLSGTKEGSVYAYPKAAVEDDTVFYSFWVCFLTGADSVGADPAAPPAGGTGGDKPDVPQVPEVVTEDPEAAETAEPIAEIPVAGQAAEPIAEILVAGQAAGPEIQQIPENPTPLGQRPEAVVSGTAETGETAIETETIEELSVPLSGGRFPQTAGWALWNLILTAVTAVIPVLPAANFFAGRKKRSEEENRARQKRRGIAGLVSAAVVLLAAVLFLLTEDMHNPMILTDGWTFWMAVLAAAQCAVALFARQIKDFAGEEGNARHTGRNS